MSLRETIGMAVDMLTRDEGVHRRLVEASVERALCAGLKPFITTEPIRQLYLTVLSRRFRVEIVAYKRLVRSTRRIMSVKATDALHRRLSATTSTLLVVTQRHGIARLRRSNPSAYNTYVMAQHFANQGALPTD